jgi:hypothetical protein
MLLQKKVCWHNGGGAAKHTCTSNDNKSPSLAAVLERLLHSKLAKVPQKCALLLQHFFFWNRDFEQNKVATNVDC